MHWINCLLFLLFDLLIANKTINVSESFGNCSIFSLSQTVFTTWSEWHEKRTHRSKIDQHGSLIEFDYIRFQFSIFCFCGFRFSVNAFHFSLSSFSCLPKRIHILHEKAQAGVLYVVCVLYIFFSCCHQNQTRAERTEHMLRHCALWQVSFYHRFLSKSK